MPRKKKEEVLEEINAESVEVNDSAVDETKPKKKTKTVTKETPSEEPKKESAKKKTKARPKAKETDKFAEGVVRNGDDLEERAISPADEIKEISMLLAQSKEGGRILSGRVMTIESRGFDKLPVAKIFLGAYTISIIANQFMELPDSFKGKTVEDEVRTYYTLLNSRIGSVVDFIVIAYDEKNRIAVGNRRAAMSIKAREYFVGFGKNAIPKAKAGDVVESRIINVVKNGVFCEVGGIETFIPLSELSWSKEYNAENLFRVGQNVFVRITSVEATKSSARISASIKQASVNPYLVDRDRLKENNAVFGVVKALVTHGIICQLPSGTIAYCRYRDILPPDKGEGVIIVIESFDDERQVIRGIVKNKTNRFYKY